MDEYGLITFKSTHAAMAAQRVLGEIKFQVCPVLRMISASCGLALRISMDDMEKAKKLLNENTNSSGMFETYCIFKRDGKQDFKIV